MYCDVCYISHQLKEESGFFSSVEGRGLDVEGRGFKVEGRGFEVEGSGSEVEGQGLKSRVRVSSRGSTIEK